jgi:penicillin-binding protein 1A
VLPYGISEIRDSDRRAVYRRAGSGPGLVVAPDLVGMMDDMLAGVIGHGTGKSAALPRPAAGKTGTTQEYRDAWFIGFTADIVAGVWLGNDDNTPMDRVTGGSLPALAWHNFMLAATSGRPLKPLLSAPRSAESPIDRLLGWLAPATPPTPLVPDSWRNPALQQRDGGE